MSQTSEDVVFSIEVQNLSEETRQIYYAGGKGSVFTYRLTRKNIIAFLIATAIMVTLYMLSYSGVVTLIVLFAISIVGTIVTGIALLYRMKEYFKWKEGVVEFIGYIRTNEPYVLYVKEHVFEFVCKGETDIEKWKVVQRAKFYTDRIEVTCPGTWYIWPAKAMSAEEYEKLREFVRKKVSEGAEEMGKKM